MSTCELTKYLLIVFLAALLGCSRILAAKSSMLPLNTVRLTEGPSTTGIVASSTGPPSDPSRRYSDFNSIYRLTALIGKSVTLTCAIEFDPRNVAKGHEFKLLWSRESRDSAEYDPLFLDETRLSSDSRMASTRVAISLPTHDRIQWSLVIDKLRLDDSRNYICQLNVEPYDTHWLKRYLLVVNEPAHFVDDEESLFKCEKISEYENTVNYIRHVNEHDDLKLKCACKGKPTPFIVWSFRYLNGSVTYLEDNSSEVFFAKVKRDLRLDRVECQIGNTFGPVLIRTFKINIKFLPYIVSKPRTIRVPVKAAEFKLNCSSIGNPLNRMVWLFKRNETEVTANESRRLHHRHITVSHRKLAKTKHVAHKKSAARKKSQETSRERSDTLSTRAWSNVSAADWLNLNNIGYYAPFDRPSNSSSTGLRLALSKYQIYEKVFPNNQISSILIIRSVTENDFGTFKCVASNELGSKFIEIKVEELNNQLLKDEGASQAPTTTIALASSEQTSSSLSEYAYSAAVTDAPLDTTSAPAADYSDSSDHHLELVDEDVDPGDAFNTKRNSHELFLLDSSSSNNSVVVLNRSPARTALRSALNSLLTVSVLVLFYF